MEYDCHRLLLKYDCLAQCSAILSLPWDWQIWLLLPRRQSRVQSQLTSLTFIERETLLAFCQSLRVWGVFVMQHNENQVDRYTSSSPSGERTTGAWLALSCHSGGLMFCFVQYLSVSPTAHESSWELCSQDVGVN